MSQAQAEINPERVILHEERWNGETRVNWVRLAALLALYGQHLLSVYVFKQSDVTAEFHRNVTIICGGWMLAILMVGWCLRRRWMPPYMKYGAALWDLTMCGLVIAMGDGPRSSLLIVLPVIVMAAAVRLSIPLVWFSTLGAMLVYLIVLGRYVYIQVGSEAYYSRPEVRISRTSELITLITIGAAGLLAGQAVRQARRVIAWRVAQP